MLGMGGRNAHRIKMPAGSRQVSPGLNNHSSEPRQIPTGFFTTRVKDPEPINLSENEQQALSEAYQEIKTALAHFHSLTSSLIIPPSSSDERKNQRLNQFYTEVTAAVDEIYNYIIKPNAQYKCEDQRRHQHRLADLNGFRLSAYCNGIRHGFIAGLIKAFLGVVALVTADKALLKSLGGDLSAINCWTTNRDFKLSRMSDIDEHKRTSRSFYLVSSALTHFKKIAKNPTANNTPASVALKK